MTLRMVTGTVLGVVFLACAMEPLGVSSTQSQTFRIAVGQELDLTVGTVGPGEYEAPPAISSGAVRFVDAQFVSPYTPGGPNQLFRFRGQSQGTALVTIQHSFNNTTIVDTVIVR